MLVLYLPLVEKISIKKGFWFFYLAHKIFSTVLITMIKFGGIRGYDQLVISHKTESDLSSGESSKWAKQKLEVFHADAPKVVVTQRHVFAAHKNQLIILDMKPLSDISDDVYVNRKEFKIETHTSAITCFGLEETSLIICSCSEENVIISKWDALLGHWDSKAISEGDGKILSCSVTFYGLAIYISLFKSDVLIVYKIISAHPATEPGPLILDSIECFSTLEKVKELTAWSKSLFFYNKFYIIGVSSGNSVSLKLWQAFTEKDVPVIKLRSHRMVSNLKNIVGADLVTDKDNLLILIVGSDGTSEVFSVSTDAFTLLYRLKTDDPVDLPSIPSSCTNNPLNTSMSALQVESRILCAKFFMISFPKPGTDPQSNYNPNISDVGGGGDAKVCNVENSDSGTEKENLDMDYNRTLHNSNICPKLLVAVVTTKGVKFINAVSGQTEFSVSHAELLKDETIFIQNAQLAIDIDKMEITLALQSCLTRIVFSRKFAIRIGPESFNEPHLTLIPRDALSSKSVLRKKIRSPPRVPITYPTIKKNKSGMELSKSPACQPAWSRSRSRPGTKLSHSKSRITPPFPTRSQSSISSAGSRLNTDNESTLSARIVKIPATGSYETENLAWDDLQKISMSSSFSHGISTLRIASTNSGKHLAFGCNMSPLVITKTQPYQNYRVYKDVGKVSNVHFNFEGNLLLVSSTDCKTTVIDWKNSKELLSFDFVSKFNEHIHSQFYFMDKFILQPEENKIVLYSIAERDAGYIKLKAGEFLLSGQTITALAAANQFYSNMVISGISNKTIQIFDTNAETISLTIPNAHAKQISCVRVNEAPKGQHATCLCDVFLTSSFSNSDPIKLWDIRSAKCIMRISDISQPSFVSTARPNLSPCGRYVATGFEDCSLNIYDIRQVKSRVNTIKKLGSTVLDCCFDTNLPMIWGGCRNGSILNFHLP